MLNQNTLINRALESIDYVGFQLEALGLTDKVNRHNVIAFLFAEQKYLEGQLDCLSARVGTGKARLESFGDLVQRRVHAGIEIARNPTRAARESLNSIKARLH